MSSTTNTDLAIMIGELSGDIKAVRVVTDRLDKTINGNGQPGLSDKHDALEYQVVSHLKLCDKQQTETKAKKEKFSVRSWGVIIIILSQAIGLIFLCIKAGMF